MKQVDIKKIETQLGLTLPVGYVEFLLKYPKEMKGPTAQKELIDDPGRLVKVNRNVRAYNRRHRSKRDPWEWPQHLFVVGESSARFLNDQFEEEKACYVIDVRNRRPQVTLISIVSGGGGEDPTNVYSLREFARRIRELDSVESQPAKSAKKSAKASKGRSTGKTRSSRGRSITATHVFALGCGPEFGKALWTWTEQRYEKLGYEKLTPGEQLLWRIRWLLLEINGNSFPGYYQNTPDDWPFRVSDDLKRIGAKKAAAAFIRIGKKLFGGEVPRRKVARSEALLPLEESEKRFEKLLRDCDVIWSQHGDDIPERSVAFAARQPELFGVEVEMC
jgi:hypothetical protein